MKRPSFIQSLFGFKGKAAGMAGLALVAALNFGAHEERVEKVETDCQTVYSQMQKSGSYNYSEYKNQTKPERLLLMATAQDLLSGNNKNLTKSQRVELWKVLVAGYRSSENNVSRFEGELRAINNLVKDEWSQFNGSTFNQREPLIDERIKFIKNQFSNLMHEFETTKNIQHKSETVVQFNDLENKKQINQKTFNEAPALIVRYLDLLNTRIGLYQCLNPSDTAEKKKEWDDLSIFLKQTEVYLENLMKQ